MISSEKLELKKLLSNILVCFS